MLRAAVLFLSTSFFWPVHAGARWLLVAISRFSLRLLTARIGTCEWTLRHSAAARGEFNLFFSDLDYSAILKDDSEKTAASVKKRYYLLKRALPWLGELEMYTEAEHTRLRSISRDWDSAYQRLRHFRKINWMRLALATESRDWVRPKYERAIQKSLARLGASNAQSALESLFPRALEPSPAHEFTEAFFFPYLGCWINATQKTAPYPAYELSPKRALAYLALLPSAGIPEELFARFNEIRQNSIVRSHHRALNEMEALIVRAVNRGSRQARQEMVDWEATFWRAHAAMQAEGLGLIP